MTIERRFAARFANNASRLAFFTWSAGQLFVYNEKVREQNYYDSLCRLIDETKRHCQPIRPECCIERPEANQQYSELIDKQAMPWLSEVPSAILGIGAYRYCQAYKRYLRGLAGKPRVHVIKESDRTLQLTRSYFTIEPTSSKKWFLLKFGSSKKPGGSIRFKAHRDFMMPAMLFVKLSASGLTVSFCCEEPEEQNRFPETPREMADRLKQYSKEELEAITIGIDRGVARPIQTSSREEPYKLADAQIEKIRRDERHRKHLQRKLAKCQKGSRNRRKTKYRLRKTYAYKRNVIEDFAHQVTHALISLDDIQVYVIEALKVKNMVKRPDPKYDEATGRPLKNGASAKAGLSEAILSSGWGRSRTYLKNKALKAGKLVVEVDPKDTSRRCPVCGLIDEKNRPSQAVFRCVRCLHTDNADHNAAVNIRDRGVEFLMAGKYEEKTRKKLLRTKKAKPSSVRLGPGRADVMPVELTAPDRGPASVGMSATNQEAPALMRG